MSESEFSFSEYQAGTGKTAIYPGVGTGGLTGICYCAMKLAGETGEVVEKIAKAKLRGDGTSDAELRLQVKKELGDVLWYVSQLATEFGLGLAEIAKGNLAKLADRQQRGVLKGSGDDR